ncbi:MAG TPA: hypothetical protein VIP77_15305 [Jiangellaceae bacterium]
MPELTPEQVTAAIRDPESGLMPVQIGVFCDDCGTTAERDYLVSEDTTQKGRFAIARAHLAKNEGWQCDLYGDFCPNCVTESWSGE